jgi:cold shock protein
LLPRVNAGKRFGVDSPRIRAIPSGPALRDDPTGAGLARSGWREVRGVLKAPLRQYSIGAIKMPAGTVKWFNATRGYGFIQPQGGGNDVFVHISAVERAGLKSLNEVQTIEFEVVSNRRKTAAENLRVR